MTIIDKIKDTYKSTSKAVKTGALVGLGALAIGNSALAEGNEAKTAEAASAVAPRRGYNVVQPREGLLIQFGAGTGTNLDLKTLAELKVSFGGQGNYGGFEIFANAELQKDEKSKVFAGLQGYTRLHSWNDSYIAVIGNAGMSMQQDPTFKIEGGLKLDLNNKIAFTTTYKSKQFIPGETNNNKGTFNLGVMIPLYKAD